MPTFQSITEEMKITVLSTRTTVRRFNLICDWPGPIKYAFPLARGTDTRNEITRVVVILISPLRKVPVPFGSITCSATPKLESPTHEGSAAGTEPRCCINKDENRFVLMQLRSQPDNQSTPCLFPRLMTLFLLLLPKGPREGVSKDIGSSTFRKFSSQKDTRHVHTSETPTPSH